MLHRDFGIYLHSRVQRPSERGVLDRRDAVLLRDYPDSERQAATPLATQRSAAIPALPEAAAIACASAFRPLSPTPFSARTFWRAWHPRPDARAPQTRQNLPPVWLTAS